MSKTLDREGLPSGPRPARPARTPSVKPSGKDNTVVVVKVLDNSPERIAGAVKKFDMQEMMPQKQEHIGQSKDQAAEYTRPVRFAGGEV